MFVYSSTTESEKFLIIDNDFILSVLSLIDMIIVAQRLFNLHLFLLKINKSNYSITSLLSSQSVANDWSCVVVIDRFDFESTSRFLLLLLLFDKVDNSLSALKCAASANYKFLS